jgi:hypothetical protein
MEIEKGMLLTAAALFAALTITALIEILKNVEKEKKKRKRGLKKPPGT